MIPVVLLAAVLGAAPSSVSDFDLEPLQERHSLPATIAPAPSLNELALLALANSARAEAGRLPLLWNSGLGAAARAHSTDMATTPCYQHNSCNGQGWSTRVRSYYPSAIGLGENIALGGNARDLHDQWMGSAGHRANILNGSFTEFGAGMVLGHTNFGDWMYGTEDFGSRGLLPLTSMPTLPAGAVLPKGAQHELLVNYFHDKGGEPRVRAAVGTECVDLQRATGGPGNGTYAVVRSIAGSCVPVVFEAIRSDGAQARWPADRTILVNCPTETSTATPSAVCGGVEPVPTPTPGSVARITSLRINRPKGKAVVLGVVSIPAGTELVAPVSLTFVGGATIEIPASCIARANRGLRSRCGPAVFAMAPAGLPEYRFRFEAKGAHPQTGVVLRAAGLSWEG